MFYKILFLFYGFILVLTQDSVCDQYILDIKEHYDTQKGYPNISQVTIINSGKGINDLGNYMACTDNADYRYILLKLFTARAEINLGLCVPAFCTQDELQKYQNDTNQIMSNLLAPQKITSSKFVDPDLVYPEFDTGAWIVAIIASIVVALNVVASIYTTVNSMQSSKKSSVSSFPRVQTEKTNSTISQQEYVALKTQTQSDGQNTSTSSEIKPLKPVQKIPLGIQLLTCFSFRVNLAKLFTIKTDAEGTFGIFNGMRVLSIIWVIYGHDYLTTLTLLSNPNDIVTLIESPGWVTLCPSAFFSVDVFFFIGGFLSAVVVIDKLNKMKRLNLSIVPAMWTHRFLRIWPTYAFCLLVYYKLSVYWFGGPVWSYYIEQTAGCEGTFWRNLLFIDNMFVHESGGKNYCFGWGWYLANDFQIFLLMPIILIIYVKSPKIGVRLMISILFGSILTAYIVSWVNDYHLNTPTVTGSPMPTYQDNFYYKPWIRISPYIMGLLYGLMFRQYKNGENTPYTRLASKLHSSYTWRVGVYVVGIALTSTVCWMIIPIQKDMTVWPKQLQYFYQAFNRVFFITGLGLVITPALIGVKNDPVSIILGHKFWVPIARVSFCMYLIQLCVIEFLAFGQTQIHYIQNKHQLFNIIVDVFYSIIFGALLSLLVEVPFMNLEKIIFAPPTKPGQTKEIE